MKQVDEAKKCFNKADAKQLLMLAFTDARRCSPARATRITEPIAEMVARDLRPLSVAKGNSFHQLLKYIEPNYQVPARPHLQLLIVTFLLLCKTMPLSVYVSRTGCFTHLAYRLSG